MFQRWSPETLETPFGNVTLHRDGEAFLLNRHGSPPLPPHRINHKANIWALKTLGVQSITAVNSVGSLRLFLKPGTFLIPDDFLCLWDTVTFFDEEMRFTVPGMDNDQGTRLYKRCKVLGVPVRMGGIYVQTRGPRLETKAEINMLKRFGHVVGMTMASEATLCLEHNIPYASICSVDNYCHGIAKVPLTMDEIRDNARRNMHTIENLLDSIHQEGLQ